MRIFTPSTARGPFFGKVEPGAIPGLSCNCEPAQAGKSDTPDEWRLSITKILGQSAFPQRLPVSFRLIVSV